VQSLTPAEELGLSGLNLAGRVRKAFYKIPEPALAEVIARMRQEAFRRHLIYLRDGQLEAIPECAVAAFRCGRAAGAQTILNPAPALPLDPFTGQPFQYRISQGETLCDPVSGQTHTLAPGQALIWSLRDHEGHRAFVYPVPARAP